MFEGSKKRNATTDEKSGGASETKKPIIKEAPVTQPDAVRGWPAIPARRSARLAGVLRR
jgi:hypothetical protein